MSKTNSGPKSSKPPAPPPPQNSYFYQDGFLRSQDIFNKDKQAYELSTFSTPDEQAIEKNATSWILGATQKLPELLDGNYQGMVDAFKAPQIRALDESYNKALGNARTAGSASGMRDSIGFHDYIQNQIEKNRANSMADIESQAEMLRYDLPRYALAPYADTFNIINAALGGEQSREMATIDPALQGLATASNAAQNNYANQMAYANSMNAYNLSRQKSPGFFSRLFGGF